MSFRRLSFWGLNFPTFVVPMFVVSDVCRSDVCRCIFIELLHHKKNIFLLLIFYPLEIFENVTFKLAPLIGFWVKILLLFFFFGTCLCFIPKIGPPYCPLATAAPCQPRPNVHHGPLSTANFPLPPSPPPLPHTWPPVRGV